MSLVGSLEDLGLGDLLQIVHLAGKSGVLRLRGDSGEGQIVFRQGMIREAHTKGGPTDLRELVAAKRAVPGPLLERAWLEAHHVGRRLAEVLVERGLVTFEALDALRREQIESAVLAMFAWPSGEFSFEMRELGDDGAELAIEPGVNPQFLALEGTRLADEGASEGAFPAESREEPSATDELSVTLEVELLAETDEPSPPPRPPVVVIDPSLAVLEWARGALGAEFPRVHVFQRPGLGIDRIRQYLARAEIPLVLIAEDTPPDSTSGARNANELAARLKRQASSMAVLLLADEGAPAPRRARFDGVLARPPAALLADPRSGRERTRIASALAEALVRHLRGPAPAAALVEELAIEAEPESPSEPAPHSEPTQPSAPAPLAALAQLRETSARIREGAGRGEVLAQVLAFAAQCFSRVAMFGVRGERVVGVAQQGLARAGGPDDAGLRELSLGSREPACFRRALDERSAQRVVPSDNGDHRLAVLLGNEIPAEAWVAPIVTGGRVAVLLYADNLPGREPLPETGALEVLLDSAGIALDRVLIERTLGSDAS